MTVARNPLAVSPAMLSVGFSGLLASAPAPPKPSVPADTVVGPVKMLSPERMMLPGPILARLVAAPARVEVMVWVSVVSSTMIKVILCGRRDF